MRKRTYTTRDDFAATMRDTFATLQRTQSIYFSILDSSEELIRHFLAGRRLPRAKIMRALEQVRNFRASLHAEGAKIEAASEDLAVFLDVEGHDDDDDPVEVA